MSAIGPAAAAGAVAALRERDPTPKAWAQWLSAEALAPQTNIPCPVHAGGARSFRHHRSANPLDLPTFP